MKPKTTLVRRKIEGEGVARHGYRYRLNADYTVGATPVDVARRDRYARRVFVRSN